MPIIQPQQRVAGPPPNLGLPMGGPGGLPGQGNIPPQMLQLIMQQMMGQLPTGPVGPEFGPPPAGGMMGPMMGPMRGPEMWSPMGGPPPGLNAEAELAFDWEEPELLETREATLDEDPDATEYLGAQSEYPHALDRPDGMRGEGQAILHGTSPGTSLNKSHRSKPKPTKGRGKDKTGEKNKSLKRYPVKTKAKGKKVAHKKGAPRHSMPEMGERTANDWGQFGPPGGASKRGSTVMTVPIRKR